MKTLLDAVGYATRYHDGHLTILRFTGNWRVTFGTPDPDDYLEWRSQIEQMSSGETLEEAITAAIDADEDRRWVQRNRCIRKEEGEPEMDNAGGRLRWAS